MTSFVAAVQDAERAQLIVDLKAARRELVARGRCTHALIKGEQVCLLGALGIATVVGFTSLTEPDQWRALYRRDDARPTRARDALTRQINRPLWAFNDDKTHTDQDVLDLFDKTLADLGGLG